MIALVFITCERFEYTERTLSSFAKHNDASEFICIHADDCSQDEKVIALPGHYGFETLAKPKKRLGCQANQQRAIKAAVERGATQVLLLQNDWEWKREFPWELYEYAFSIPSVYCLRLFGVYKEDGKRPCGVGHYGKNKKRVDWILCADAPEPAQIGDIHWTHTPTVTDSKLSSWLIEGPNERDAMLRSGKLDKLTVRPLENVVSHFGAERTPSFRP